MNKLTFLSCSLITFFIKSIFTLFLLYPVVLGKLAVPSVSIGWMVAAFFIGSTMVRTISAKVVESLGIKKTLFFSSLLLGILGCLFVWVQDIKILFLLRFITGIFYGIFMVAISAYEAFIIPEEKRGCLYGWLAVSYVLPQLFVFPFVDVIVQKGMLPIYFSLIPLFSFVAAGLVVSLPDLGNLSENQKEQKTIEWGTWNLLLTTPGLRKTILTTLLFSSVSSSALHYLPSLIFLNGFGPSFFIISSALTALFIRILGSKLMDYIDRSLISGFFIMLMGIAIFPVIYSTSNIFLVIGGILYGIGMGVSFPIILALIPDLLSPRFLPKGVSLSLFTKDFGSIIGPLSVGYGWKLLGLKNTLLLIGCLGTLGGVSLFISELLKRNVEYHRVISK